MQIDRKWLAGLVLAAGAAVALAQRPGATGAGSLENLAREFANPGTEYRGKPFWSWNGKLEEPELKRQIQVLKEMGMGGLFMHSRTGLRTEYLGDEWFRLINSSADEAQRLSMEAHLYDEDRWPSGTAGGLVTKIPEYRSKFISLETVPLKDFRWRDGIVAAFACDLKGTRFTTCRRLTAGTPGSGEETALVFTVEQMEPTSFYNGYTYADTLNRKATDYYIQLTHERYAATAGDRLGKSILGIFTDEPHRGAVFGGFGIQNRNKARMTPWTYTLPGEFQRRFGYDLIERLPELYFQKNGEAVSPVKWHYMELLQSMFLENWAKPLQAWCRQHGIAFTGHVLHEDSLAAQAAMQGSLARFYEVQDTPGVDVLTEGNRNYWIVKQVASVARQTGKRQILSELYGVTGWQFNFESHKYVGDWQALFGVNLRCHHLAWYTMGGEAKRDYPASIFFQSGWWKDYRYVEDYYARLNLMLAQGEPARDVLMVTPIESMWAETGVGWANGLAAQTQELREIETAYQQAFQWLTEAHIDFDYGDEEMMGRLGSVSRDDRGPLLRIGKATYRAAVVPRMVTIRAGTLRLLGEFHRAGGSVIFAGTPPPYVEAVKSPAASELAARAEHVAWDGAALVAACARRVTVPVEVLDVEGRNISKVFAQLRTSTDHSTLALMSMDRAQWQRGVHVRVKASGAVSEWMCEDGRRFSVPSRPSGEWTEWTADFAPLAEHVFVLGGTAAALPRREVLGEKARVTLAGPFEYRLNEPNVLVLDLARYQVKDQPWGAETEVLKIDRAVRTAFGLEFRSGTMIQSWFSRKFEPAPQPLGQIRMIFDFDVETLPTSAVDLAIEEPRNFRVSLNGTPVDAAPSRWWIDPAIRRVTLPAGALRVGANHLEVVCDFRKDVNIEAAYLLGDFGVRVDGTRKTVVRLPARLEPSDAIAQGLPFYSGSITYRVPVAAAAGNGQRLFVELPNFEAACVKVRSGAQPERMIAWQPYRAEVQAGAVEVETVLTRRNTFGPLHLAPMRSAAYGPGHWVTEGKAWSQAYQLYPAGLLESPVIVTMENR